MKKIIITALLLNNLFATDIQIHPTWNMLGVSSDTPSSNLVLNAGEVIYTYENETWSKYDTTHTGTIKAGSGFWLYSSATRTLGVAPSNSEKLWSNGWNLVSPIDKTWSIKENFPTVSYAWRWVDGGWKLYDKAMTSGNYGYETVSDVTIGEGIWVKSTHNGLLGNSPINIIDGEFESVKKTALIVSTEAELLDEIKNTYDMGFDINASNSNLNDFLIGLKLTRITTNSVYYYFIKVDSENTFSSPYVVLSKENGSISGALVENPVIEKNSSNTTMKLNFNKIVKYLSRYWYSVDELQTRLQMKSDYKVEVYGRYLDIIGGEKLTSSEMLNNTYNFPIGSSKIEGILTIK